MKFKKAEGKDIATRYSHNLALLTERFPDLAARMPTMQADPGIQTVMAASGAPTAFRSTPDGRSQFLHSRIDPVEEGAAWADMADSRFPVAFILGMGLGYHVRAFVDRSRNLAAIHVIDVSEQVFHTALEAVDFAPLLAHSQMNFWIGMREAEMASAVSALTSPFSFHLYLPSLSVNPGYYDKVVRTLEKKQYDNRLADTGMQFFAKGIERLLGEMTR